MYCTTPSGTRYQTGMPRATRSRQSVELIDSAGTSARLTTPSGRWASASVQPGRDEDDLVQAEEPGDLARGHEVPVVDGIERPAHHPDPAACHRSSVSGGHRDRPARDRPRRNGAKL